MDVIEVQRLHKRYRDHVAVHAVSFTVHRGEIFGVLGPNGAGKTTTVECVTGMRVPDGGSVRVLGLDPHRDHDTLLDDWGLADTRRTPRSASSPAARSSACSSRSRWSAIRTSRCSTS
jgi:ABC-type uncharacterized transport system ATPase subunit